MEYSNSSNFGERQIQVAATPNGLADGIGIKQPENVEYFVLPEEQMMSMSQFLDQLDSRENKRVLYLQKQNSNLIQDFPELLNDIDMNTLQFASESFNKPPDAINFWMGEDRAVTSLHKDPYENVYCVISGYKDFTLISHIDLPFIARSKYPSGVYKTVNGEMIIEPVMASMKQLFFKDSSHIQLIFFFFIVDNNCPVEIEWVSVDPLKPDFNTFPEFEKATKFNLRLFKGDILYLPSLWYHHVQQSHKAIG